MTTLATYWSMTINNPDDNDYVLVRNPNDKYIRSVVWTSEIGKGEETPHLQCWVRLHRNNSMAFIKKLYPRGHFKPITRDEYNENVHRYAQKEDETTAGYHHIVLNDPLPGVDTILYRVLERVYERTDADNKLVGNIPLNEMLRLTHQIEDEMVSERAGLEKLFISGSYDKMKRRFYNQIISRLVTKHADDNEGEEGELCGTEEEGTSSVQDSIGQSDGCTETDEGSYDCYSESSE